MAAVDFNKPVVTDLRADVLLQIRTFMAESAKGFDGTVLSNTPDGLIRYNSTSKKLQKWNAAGPAFVDLPLRNIVSDDILLLTGGADPLVRLPAANGTPWAFDLYRTDTANSSRVKNGGGFWAFEHRPTFAGNAPWDAGNFTPSSKLDTATYTASDILTKIKTVDGSGSGLDADLLDGLNSSAFAQLGGAAFTGAVSGTTFSASSNMTVAGNNVWHAGNLLLSYAVTSYGSMRDNAPTNGGYVGLQWGNGYHGLTFMTRASDGLGGVFLQADNVWQWYYDPSIGTIRMQGTYPVWHSNNDGSGSGLDADLLDGQHASAFLNRSVDVWQTSTDGYNRFYFSSSGRSYYGANDGHEFRRQDGTTLMQVLNDQRVITQGLIYARNGGVGMGQIQLSTLAPSGGANGDIWMRY